MLRSPRRRGMLPRRRTRKSLGTKGAHVLLVEDDPISLEVCVAILESMGCTVETATDGLHALDRHARGEFALIFMDCFMPEMDGYEATSEIRRREAHSRRRTPIVALTGDVTEGARERCLAAGMDDYLAKPFKLDQIKAMLTTWLSPSTHAVKREHLALVPALSPDEPIDYKVLASLGQLQREGRPDIVQEMIHLFFKAAADLLEGFERRRGKWGCCVASPRQPCFEVGQCKCGRGHTVIALQRARDDGAMRCRVRRSVNRRRDPRRLSRVGDRTVGPPPQSGLNTDGAPRDHPLILHVECVQTVSALYRPIFKLRRVTVKYP